MKKLAVLLSLLLAALVACGTSNDNGGETTGSPKATETTSAPPHTSSSPAPSTGKQPPIESGDWRLESITVRDDGLGSFGGRARITYTGANPAGGDNTFTITVFKGGKDIASLQGSASDVPPNRTVTADLISSDPFEAGPYTFDFQKDF